MHPLNRGPRVLPAYSTALSPEWAWSGDTLPPGYGEEVVWDSSTPIAQTQPDKATQRSLLLMQAISGAGKVATAALTPAQTAKRKLRMKVGRRPQETTTTETTGGMSKVLPWVLGGVGLLTVVGVVALVVRSRR